MKKYFTCDSRTGCGFPSVTLLGSQSDRQNVRQRLEFLTSRTYGEDLTTWTGLLVLMFNRFVTTFEKPDDEDLKDFWMQVCHASRRMSGQTERFSGWITVFAYLTADRNRNPPRSPYFVKTCVLSGKTYPVIKQDNVLSGMVAVPVLVKDSGKEFRTVVVAGCVGMMVQKKLEGDEEKKEGVQYSLGVGDSRL
jgi:hypothetical protein